MKCSIYNFIIPLNELEYAIYNSKTNALAIINDEELNVLKNIEGITNFKLYEKIIDDFRLGEYIVDSSVNELNDIKYKLLKSRYSTNSLTLIIAPTMSCNFRCTYCYEKNHLNNSFMSNKIMKSIIDFVRKKSVSIDNLNICWYGGEPLLAFDIIEKLTKELKKICSEGDIFYSSFMVTNGYLLNKSISSKLRELDINSLQITIDGDKKSHNSRRVLANGEGTYDTIISNLKENIDVLPNVILRINLDKDNIDSQYELIDIIKDFDIENKIFINIAKVENSSGNCLYNRCFTDEEFHNYEMDFIKKSKGEVVFGRYPKIISNVCGADCISSFIINYDGGLYKCWSDIGIEDKRVGFLENGSIKLDFNGLYFDYLLYDATEDQECRNCKYLPICMGGCPRDRLLNENKKCTFYKYKLDSYILNLIDSVGI